MTQTSQTVAERYEFSSGRSILNMNKNENILHTFLQFIFTDTESAVVDCATDKYMRRYNVFKCNNGSG